MTTDITINCTCEQMDSVYGNHVLVASSNCPIHNREARVNLLLKLWSENNPHCQGFGSQELVAEIKRLRQELAIFKTDMPPLTDIWNFSECLGGDPVCGWLSGIVRKLRGVS